MLKRKYEQSENPRVFPSPSTSTSSRKDVSQERAAKVLDSHPGWDQYSTFGSAAGDKRNHKKEPGQIEQPQEFESDKPSPNSSHGEITIIGQAERDTGRQGKRLKLSGDDFPKKQKVQLEETVPEKYSPICERLEERLEASECGAEEEDDPISYWVANHTWPSNFAKSCAMSSSNDNNKRQRMSDRSQSGNDEKSRSYSQSRKDGNAPEQYTKSYENYILTQGLNMDYFEGEKLLSPDSKVTCNDLQKLTCVAISPTVYSKAETLEVIRLCINRNEAMVSRDVTPLIVPPIKSLYLKDGVNHLEHFTDEVNTQWHGSWVLAGPRPKPDLAVGFSTSAFSIAENKKIINYTSFENLTRPTDELYFPFLMCEVKCGNEGLDWADRQNMHSCSVAVKALLKLEQKADQYREDTQFESLLGRILVYSISHDQKDARLYGHYALVEGERWIYHRHCIEKFDIGRKEKDLLALHNFARNVLTLYAPKLLRRLQKAIAVLPVSSTLSSSSGTMNFEVDSQQGSQQFLQGRDAEGFATPVLPASTQKSMDKLLQLLQDSKEREERRERQMQQQMEGKDNQIKELTDMLKRQIAGK